MFKVFSYPNTRGTRITWMLEEVGAEYDFQLVDLYKGEHRSPEYLAINPAGKIPAFQHDDLLLVESGAIVTYIGDQFPESGLVPAAGTPERGLYEQWSYFVLCELEQPLWTMGKHRFALPEEHRVKEIFDTAGWEFQKALQLFSEGLGDKPYILGEQFSAADLLLAHTLNWAVAFKQPIPFDNLKDYSKRINQRPALTKARTKEQAALDG